MVVVVIRLHGRCLSTGLLNLLLKIPFATQNTLRLNSGEVKRTSGAGLLGSGVEEVVEEVEEDGGCEELTSDPLGPTNFPNAFLPN